MAPKADNLTAIREQIVCKMWEPRRLTTLWAFTACYRDSFTFFTVSLKSTMKQFTWLPPDFSIYFGQNRDVSY
jgi:hypothetical protein